MLQGDRGCLCVGWRIAYVQSVVAAAATLRIVRVASRSLQDAALDMKLVHVCAAASTHQGFACADMSLPHFTGCM
jgi:hypothetical protein